MKILDVPQSGSVAGVTSSRNRFGQYRRSRAIPVNPSSSFQGVVRARFGTNAAAWKALTATQRAGWTSLGALMTRQDSLGQSYTLTGLQAFMCVNDNLSAAGEALLSDAPAFATPGGLATAVITLTAAAFSIAYTVTPLAASTRLFSYFSPQRSAGRQYESDVRLTAVSAAAAASPANVFAAYQARFGTPVVGNRIFCEFRTHKGGFVSAPLFTSAVVA
jgi:hypothetical protein